MVEEIAAARITQLMGTGQSDMAARELSIQMQQLQQTGRMREAQELLWDTKQDFNQAGFGQNLQERPIRGTFGQVVGNDVIMMTQSGPHEIARLAYQAGYNADCNPYQYGLAGMAVGANLNLRFGNFDLNIGSYPMGYGGVGPFYAPPPNWQNSPGFASFNLFLGQQHLNYGAVQQSFNRYPVGSPTVINNTTIINNESGGNRTINNGQTYNGASTGTTQRQIFNGQSTTGASTETTTRSGALTPQQRFQQWQAAHSAQQRSTTQGIETTQPTTATTTTQQRAHHPWKKQ